MKSNSSRSRSITGQSGTSGRFAAGAGMVVVEELEQLRLHRQRHLPDFVEEERPFETVHGSEGEA